MSISSNLVSTKPRSVLQGHERGEVLAHAARAGRFESTLGYGWLRQAMERKVAQSDAQKLAHALWELESDVFTEESVEVYKENKRLTSEAKHQALATRVKEYANRLGHYKADVAKQLSKDDLSFGCKVGIFLCVGAVILGISLCCMFSFLTGLVCGAGALVLAIVTANVISARRRHLVSERAVAQQLRKFTAEADEAQLLSWSAVPLEKYEEEVPEELLMKACQLKELVPDVQFEVHFTTSTQLDVRTLVEVTSSETMRELERLAALRRQPLPDPFLVATRQGERYVIGVWDERNYNPQLQDVR